MCNFSWKTVFLADDVGRWRSACACESRKNQRLQEQRKESFLTLAKENQSPLGLFRNPLTFFFTNPRFELLIRDRLLFCSLSVALPCLSLITGAYTTHTSYVISKNSFCLRQLEEVKERCLYCFNKDISIKTHGFARGGLYSPPELCEATPIGFVWKKKVI